MSKFKFLGQFERDAIPAMLPADFRGMIPMFAKPGVEYSVVLFSYNRERGGVATSSDVRRALAQLPTESRVMAVGTDFTAEATQLLEKAEAIVLRIGEYGWTDASYKSLHEPAT
jgi:hypothetical protein